MNAISLTNGVTQYLQGYGAHCRYMGPISHSITTEAANHQLIYILLTALIPILRLSTHISITHPHYTISLSNIHLISAQAMCARRVLDVIRCY